MNFYEEKKAARKERYERYAENADKRSQEAYEKARHISSYIPPGQPILVGHHSEKRHRADISRIDNQMRTSINEQKKSEYWADRAASVETNIQIDSDDPDAITKLKDKIESLLIENQKCKEVNKRLGKFKTWEILQKSGEEDLIKYVERKRGYYASPSNMLRDFYLDTSRNTREIRRLKERIEGLQRTKLIQDFSIGEIDFKVIDGQIRVYFPGIPSESTRLALKKTFQLKFSRYSKAWVRKLTPSISGFYINELRKCLSASIESTNN